MPNTAPLDQLTMTWHPVIDSNGRTHMEAAWTCPSMRDDVAVTTVHAA